MTIYIITVNLLEPCYLVNNPLFTNEPKTSSKTQHIIVYLVKSFDEVLLDIALYYHNNHKTYHHHA